MRSNRARFVSRLTNNTMALILAGGRGERLGVLTDWRTKPAVPFGGKFRIIDFTLSNCMHSGINKICVLTQYKSHSLNKHLVKGWSKINNERGDFLDIIPAQQWTDKETWFQGTADAVFQSLDIIESYKPDYVIILAGDHIYNMDYGEMLAEHVNTGADFSVACMTVESEKAANQFGVLSVDDTGRITHFEEKPKVPTTVPGQKDMALVSMGVYLVSNEYLAKSLREDALSQSSTHDFGRDIIPEGIRRGDNFHAHTFRNPTNEDPPYWRDVGTIDSYYSANIELLKSDPPINLYDADWSPVTYQRQLPPALFTCPNVGANVQSSMISGGCVLGNSQVRKSILFSEVSVENSCELDGVLALAECRIGANSNLRNVILDNGCIIPEGTTVGYDLRSDAANYHVTEGGTVVINRRMLGQSVRYNPEL
jgi:glucose-1-phosphate adenylyltransferase